MWKVINLKNKPTLNRYKGVIISFFELVIDLSKVDSINDKLEEDDYLENKFTDKANLDSKLLSINKSAENKIKPLIKEIIKLDTAILEKEFEIFKVQNEEISKFNYNLKLEIHPAPLKKVFKDYFYDQFFGKDWIWTDLVGTDFNREKFKTNFKDDNKLYVCSYCDTDTISNTRNAWLEHFLPKSKFPYVACNPDNLIPSCTSCNVSGSGKGEDVKIPISNQYTTQVGDELEFAYENGEIIIRENEEDSIENYVELLKLRSRYKEESVKENILSTLKVNYNTINDLKIRGEFDKNMFFDFIHNIGRNRGLYFVQKDLLNYIDEI